MAISLYVMFLCMKYFWGVRRGHTRDTYRDTKSESRGAGDGSATVVPAANTSKSAVYGIDWFKWLLLCMHVDSLPCRTIVGVLGNVYLITLPSRSVMEYSVHSDVFEEHLAENQRDQDRRV